MGERFLRQAEHMRTKYGLERIPCSDYAYHYAETYVAPKIWSVKKTEDSTTAGSGGSSSSSTATITTTTVPTTTTTPVTTSTATVLTPTPPTPPDTTTTTTSTTTTPTLEVTKVEGDSTQTTT